MDRRTDGQTDRHGFGILIWKHVGTQKILTQCSKLVVSCRSLYASRIWRTGMHNIWMLLLLDEIVIDGN